MTWQDTIAFCEWPTGQERKAGHLGEQACSRLPTDLGWSAVVDLTREPGTSPAERNLKTKGVYPWGASWPPTRGAGNFAEEKDLAVGQTVLVNLAVGAANLPVFQRCTDLWHAADQSPPTLPPHFSARRRRAGCAAYSGRRFGQEN